jgi:hypothetical protein
VTVQYSVSTGANSFTAAAHTAIEINPGSSMPAELVAMDISSPYLTSGTPISVLVELVSNTASGTGTGYTPKKFGQAVGTALSTTKINDSVEPSTPTVVMGWELVFPAGPFSYQWPLGREYFLGVSTFNAIRVTPSATITLVVNAVFEE